MRRGLEFEREKGIVVNYKGIPIAGQRIDLVVASCVLVELKATITLHVIHEAKVISYLENHRPPTRLVVEFPRAYVKARIEKNSLLTIVR